MRIALLAAMPGEYRPLLRQLVALRKLSSDLPPRWSGRILDKDILVVETGIGMRHAAEAVRCMVARYPLDLVLSVGFAGGLSPDLQVGQLLWSRELAVFDEMGKSIELKYRCAAAPAFEDYAASRGIRPARFVSVEHLQPKTLLAAITGDTTSIVEMESGAVAEVAHRHGIPFLGLRSISDTATEDVDLDLDGMVDRRGRVSVPRATWAVLRRPALVPSYRRWAADSRIAGDALTHALVAVLRLPEKDLRTLVLRPF
jgi:adenosylhomocysteine nucleosidase